MKIRLPGNNSRRRRPLAVELLEDRLVLRCNSPDPFICTPLPNEGTAVHIHPHLRIFVNGQEQAIPTNLGIEMGPSGLPTGFLPIHTHDTSGTIHVESPTVRDFHLRDFFAVWDQPLSRTQLLQFSTTLAYPVRMTVNGQPSDQFGDLVLRDAQQIEIRLDNATTNRPGTLKYSAPVYTVAADAGSVTTTVTRADGSDGTVTVHYATSDGSGRAGVDYVAASGDLTFGPGETTKTYPVTILNSHSEGVKTVNLTLSNPTGGATLGAPARATITITNIRPPTTPPPTTPPPTTPPPTTPDPAINRNYVSQIYRDFYRREADASGLNTWAGALDRGVSRTDVMLSLAGTDECRTKIVTQIYQDLLGRAPDQAGLTIYTTMLALGGTAEQVRAFVCGSDEYFGRHGSNNATFLESLYRDTLGRDLDAAGRDGFIRALANGQTRDKVAQAVYFSAEYREKLATGLYQAYLGRVPDPGGLSYWTEALRVGTRDEHVRVGFLTSPEYVNRYAHA